MEEGGGKGERAGLGEWDEDLGKNISEDELSGLYSRISAMREREVEVMKPRHKYIRIYIVGILRCCGGDGSMNQHAGFTI